MVQRGFNVPDLALAGGLRARSGNRKSKGNRRERFHSGLLGRNVCLKTERRSRARGSVFSFAG
jgi:hypothetical protein